MKRSKKLVYDNEWFVRENQEIDDKIPEICSLVIKNRVNYRNPDLRDIEKVSHILERELLCYDDLTMDELEFAIEKIFLGCDLCSGLKALSKDGLVKQTEDGKYKFCSKKSVRKKKCE